ncbi:MAG: VIT domain-containing protein [Nostoc sp. DedVER02]|uniref:VIT domain-containing protein n=1 Tax=unclassified Nostoc TaxID=2593658 RepID=UPI002AD3503B|nr:MULTISPECIES: VIT domain-containing protein [unclassified Nostoc]MDZ7985408.1 VIT domain-containing protein [Nostoc sp. DedVER02]MDZ8116874.1 VIT domain-containing protein [Nostoc sp. DedVER01b]
MTQTLEQQPSGLYLQNSSQQIAFPLKHTEVKAKIAGNISRVEVTQSFENPFTTTLEAVYIFPLPDEAAVDDMLIRIGDRTIQGSIKKRQEALAIYEQARKQGQTAGLLEQERDNIFTQSLANIKPGEQIDVIICYSDSLKFEGGNYEFVFPMVVGPRYIPGITIEENAAGGGSAIAPMTLNQDTDLVPDASRLNAPILPDGMRSSHDINVTIEINAGVEIQDINSPSHQIQIIREGQLVNVKLGGGDTIPNKDLILRYQVSSNNTQTTTLTQADERGGHFALYMIPAVEYRPDEIVAKDMVFLIDSSGSQSGEPLMQCQELMRRFINGLNPDDTFSIIDFSDTTQQLSPVPLANTFQNRLLAINYINRLNAGGGTEMLGGIRTVLNLKATNPGRLRNIVLLTDGYIGNENQILAEVKQRLQPGTRLHSFGAGSSVNRFLLNRIAELGRGIARIIRHDEPVDEVVEKFFRQINNPVLANIQLQWEGDGESPIMYPSTPPDLFAEQPLVLFGRKPDAHSGKLHVTGIAAGGKRYQHTFHLNFPQTGNPAIAQLWGRSRIKDLMNQMVSGDTKAGVEAVTDTALTYQLLSQYTAFVAVSDDIRVNPKQDSISVQVPVEIPEAISYEGIFSNVSFGAAPGGGMARNRQEAKKQSAPPLPSPMSVLPPPSPMSAPAKPMQRFEEMESLSEIELGYAEDSSNLDSLLLIPESSMPQLEDLKTLRKEESSVPHLQVVSVTGLNQQMISLLTQYLQAIQLPRGFGGDLVFEFQLNQGRVRQLLLDEQTSSLKEQTVIELIKRSLLAWLPSQTLTSTVVLTLRIQP